MDLKNANKEYLDAKAKLENVSKEVEAIEKRKKIADLSKRKHEVARDEADINGDKAKKDIEQAEIDKAVEEIEKIEKELEEKKKEVKSFEDTINKRIEEIKQDPAMKQTMNEALEKRYDRQLKKYEKEKETVELEKFDKLVEKSRYENLKQLITEHPALEMNLNGILSAKETIKKLNDELATLDYQKDAKRIAEITGKEMKEATDKLDKNKEPLMNYINKHKINIKYEDIEKLAETGLSLDETIDGLGKDIKGCNKKIKGYDKNIHNYSVALENIRGEMEQPEQTGTQTPPSSENKPKWYQFGKRFKNWIEQKRQSKLPAPTPTKRPDTIRDALKYDVVRDLVGYDDKIKDSNNKVIGTNHHFGTMEQAQLHEATGRKKEEPEGPEL